MSPEGLASDAKRDAVRAIRALADAINLIDQGAWAEVPLAHIKANIQHLEQLRQEIMSRRDRPSWRVGREP